MRVGRPGKFVALLVCLLMSGAAANAAPATDACPLHVIANGVVERDFRSDEFEEAGLGEPVPLPPGVYINQVLHGEFYVDQTLQAPECCEERYGLWRPGEASPRWIGTGDLYPESAVRTKSGEVWAIVRGGAQADEIEPPVRLLHVAGDGHVELRRIRVQPWARNAKVVVTTDDRPVLLFVQPDSGRQLKLMLSWSMDTSDALLVDRVVLSSHMAERIRNIEVDIAAAPQGAHGLAIAWRPFTDRRADSPGDDALAAQVRWLVAAPGLPMPKPHAFSTSAQPPMVSLPIAFESSGLAAASLQDQVLFAWVEKGKVLGVRASEAVPTSLVEDDRISKWFASEMEIRDRGERLELRLLRGESKADSFFVECR